MNSHSRKIERNQSWYCKMIHFLLHFCVVSASTLFPGGEDGVLHLRASTGRNILQIQQDCPINFESQNSTTLTNQCKGPPYENKPCCDAMKEFACPFSQDLNNKTNDCMTRMFSFFNILGYPVGLFTSLCSSRDGIQCPPPPPMLSPDSDNHHVLHHPSLLLMLSAFSLVLLAGF